MLRPSIIALLCVSNFCLNANDLLDLCWIKQVQPIADINVSYQFEEIENGLSHSMNLWDQYSYNIKGNLDLTSNGFGKADTLTTISGKQYVSKVRFDQNLLLIQSYGKDELSKVNINMHRAQFINACRYSPILILDYFYKNSSRVQKESLPTLMVFHTQIYAYRVSLYIDKDEAQVVKIRVLSDLENDDEYYRYGDVVNEYIYKEYSSIGDFQYPRKIKISKLNDKLMDTVSILNAEMKRESANILEIPEGYELLSSPKSEIDITVEEYTKGIYLINLHHCGTRSLMVEFDEFVFVAESPLNSKNGELLLNEVQKIAPSKPIKYFAFGHFHPHYTGGMRPFIHKGAEILCVEEDQSYVEFIANGNYSINIDSLQLEPKKLKFSFVNKEKRISDDSMELIIYHIGNQSNHTNDYLIYYFPNEKMLFQDDLVWLRENSTKENLSKTTKGLYTAIKSLGIDVDEIVQNWHVFDKENPMKFKFADIVKIMEE